MLGPSLRIRKKFEYPLGYARDGVVTLRESPSTISSLVSLLVLIARLPTNELRVATNA